MGCEDEVNLGGVTVELLQVTLVLIASALRMREVKSGERRQRGDEGCGVYRREERDKLGLSILLFKGLPLFGFLIF